MISSRLPFGWWRTVKCGIAVGRWSDEQLRRWATSSAAALSDLALAEERRRRILDGPFVCPRCGSELPTNDVHRRPDGTYCSIDATIQS